MLYYKKTIMLWYRTYQFDYISLSSKQYTASVYIIQVYKQ